MDAGAFESWLAAVGDAEESVKSPFFQSHRDSVVGELIRRVTNSLTTPSELRVALEALNVIGDYEALFKAHVVPVLAELLWEQSSEALHTTITTLCGICQSCALSERDLAPFDVLLIHYIFDIVENTRDMADTGLNFATIRLLLALSDQFESLGVANRVIEALGKRIKYSQAFSENLAILYNRGVETDITHGADQLFSRMTAGFVARVFLHKSTANLFYVNDVKVIADTALREIINCTDDQEELRLAHLLVLYYLLLNSEYRSSNHKRSLVTDALAKLLADPLVGAQSKQQAERILLDCVDILEI